MAHTFKELAIGQTFDWIDDANPSRNSFFARCIKVSVRKYVAIDTGKEYAVGSINAVVYHVAG